MRFPVARRFPAAIPPRFLPQRARCARETAAAMVRFSRKHFVFPCRLRNLVGLSLSCLLHSFSCAVSIINNSSSFPYASFIHAYTWSPVRNILMRVGRVYVHLRNGIVNRHEFRPIGEGPFHLELTNHLRNTGHHIF